MKVIAVIPAYNEAARIKGTVEAVRSLVDEVVVIDDGSADDTAAQARKTGVTVLHHGINRGQGAALKTGTMAAIRLGADVIIHVDGDGQHDPADMQKLIQPIAFGEVDVVFGSRFLGTVSSMPFTRHLLLNAARAFNTLVVGIPSRVTDPQSGMRALSRRAALQVDFHQDRMAHCSEILRLVTRSELRWKEVPIHVRYTPETLAKGQRSTDALKIVWQLFLGAWRR